MRYSLRSGSASWPADGRRARAPQAGAWSFRDLVDPRAPVSAGAGWLQIGELEVDWTGAACRVSRPAWRALRGRRSVLARGLGRLGAVCGEEEVSAGDATVALGLRFRRTIWGKGEGIVPRLHWLLASAHARRFWRALAGADTKQVGWTARALAGLGPGLTPAGDDLLLGALYALWATRPPRYAAVVGTAVADAAAPRTTSLSAAWLRAAARGESEWVWVRLVRALARDERAAVMAAARAVPALGHSSGRCALHGFVAGARALLRARCDRGRLDGANHGGAPDGRAGHGADGATVGR
jgi:hypothetical protein